MSNFADQVRDHLPAHYQTEYPKFVQFLEKYYEWFYRQEGISAGEKAILLEKRDWLKQNIDLFINEGQIRDLASTEAEVEQAIQAISEQKGPGAVSKDFIPDTTLERKFVYFTTSDGEMFTTKDDAVLQTKDLRSDVARMWANHQGFLLPSSGSEIGRMDEILFVRMIKHLNLVKGTQKAAELFFSVFFDENISENNGGNGAFHKPKFDIFVIDDLTSLIDDSKSVIRDDEYYNEFAYVIKVKRDPEFYKLAFEQVYLKYLHPAGFKVFLEPADPDEVVRPRHEFSRASQATFVGEGGVMVLVGFDVPRFQNNNLLIEGEKTNILRKSVDVDTTDGWTIGTGTVRAGKTTSPFGSQNATIYTRATAGAISVSQVVTPDAGKQYSTSIYARLAGGTDPTGVLTSQWRRYTIGTHNHVSGTYTFTASFTVPANASVAFACAQMEAGGVTSYIPTYLSGATRAADIVIDDVQ